ncbi:putative secreted protein [Wickerhamomyces ciferrii]|uniref:Secreted protein n=1 Tax=Wickerhamomyces ciferrii (strain ATCC 14091 / BCRC 22168 / CBS 111 / JCM 3599 / NBRC 0793 / NRRL Y-1031 F-60-10) TaxID=1206466 RepID=K0KTP4_WICCF|nr:uncharacterized protein BN7_6134 [Wickerhamomyces ciferrii]CCH46541.1 putative secreted protein [Wickerhamomyces ciferrii]
MKLSSIFIQGLLLSGIMASPVADSNSFNDNPTIEGASQATKLCFDANKSDICSAIIVQGLLSLSVIALPTAFPDATESLINAENSTLLSSDNSTDSFNIEAGGVGNLCFNANSKKNVCQGSVKKCVEIRAVNYKGEKSGVEEATRLCRFYCSKIRSATQCKQSKYKANYHPKWACDDIQYC